MQARSISGSSVTEIKSALGLNTGNGWLFICQLVSAVERCSRHQKKKMKIKKILLPFFLVLSIACDAQQNKDSIYPGLLDHENRNLQFDSVDLKIIERADAILSDSSAWHKNDDRVCEDDISNGKYSLFCALYKASKDITGEYVHRRPGMQLVRFVVEKYENGRVKEHRLMDWNNHPDTKFEEVKKVLKESVKTVKAQLK